ncbi:MAG: ABC transporter ATP-binding protein [Hyphomicrobiales bacterium]|nr:ABC transporter ATP-binding protein [Hyphomicrobiales bacterium]
MSKTDEEKRKGALADAAKADAASLSKSPGRPENKTPNSPAATAAQKAREEDEDEDDEEDDEDEDEDDDLVTAEREEPVAYTAGQAIGGFKAVYDFIRPHLSAHRLGIFLVIVGLLIETAFNVIMPLALKYLIDEVFDSGDVAQLTRILVILGVAGLITSIIAIWYEWQDAKVTADIATDVRRDLFDHIQRLPVAFYIKTKRGEILSRFSGDITTVEQAVTNLAKWGALPLFELIAGVALLIYLNWRLGLVALLILPITLIGPRLVTPHAVRAGYQLRRAEAGELGVVNENIGAQTVVKAFGLQSIAQGWFGEKNEILRGAMRRSTFLNTIVERSLTIAVLWLHLAVLAAGAYLTFNNEISVGVFVAFESAFWEITYNLNHLTQYIPVAIDAAAATQHINDILHQPARVSDKDDARELPPFHESIDFNNVHFSYDGRSKQLDGVSFSIPHGRSVAIVGPSGAGKSTILNLLMRFYDPDSGSVSVDGHDIADVTRDSLRGQMAIVFQDNVLFNTTYRENIRLGKPDATDAEVEAAAKAAEIYKFINQLPQGFDTMVGERGETLSGGQRQRIAIARALLRDPPILLLDEATSALDQQTESALVKTLTKAAKGRTVISVTHRLGTIVNMDEIIVMQNGNVVQRGPHAELVRQDGLYRELWEKSAH